MNKRLKAVLDHVADINHDAVPQRGRAKYVANKYEISVEEYLALALKQNGCCAICGGRNKEGPQRRAQHLAVDHCHASEKVRGLLCTNCNLGLGNFQDSPAFLRLAAAYLER